MASTTIYQWASKETGSFQRQVSSFRNVIGRNSTHIPEKGKYRLYVSLACPWAHRTLIMRKLKGLESVIDISVVDYLMGEKGWRFDDSKPGCIPDPQYKAEHLSFLYLKANPNYNARFTVPVLWDSKLETIVNNESSEIIRILNDNDFCPSGLSELSGASTPDYYPADLRAQIDSVNEWIYNGINNGVYKTGFATKQEVYEDECKKLFASLDRVENELLAPPRTFLVGEKLTEADIRLFTTIVRFDPVYFGHFKCNCKSIGNDYPNILAWLRRLYAMPAFKETTNMEHIKKHYYMSHKQINPNQIVALSDGPALA